jgi:sugar phosphate isomerase/epimerase
MKQNRRNFIKTTTTASAGILLSSLKSFAETSVHHAASNRNYDLKIFNTDWGFDGSQDAFCEKIQKAGYDGLETSWPDNLKDREALFIALKKYKLDVGFLCGAWGDNAVDHFVNFKKMVTDAAKLSSQKPVYINCHSARDHYSFEENKKFIDFTIGLSKETGIKIYHETHRSRILFAAHITAQFIEKIPDLRLTLDISHWCNVHESLLGDQKAAVDLALERTDHIHARIGFEDGPQVNDPRAPEWDYAVKQHFEWWDKVVERKKKNGEQMTFLTEFGPPLYMPTLPYTLQTVSDQWTINVHMLKLLRKRYS